MTAKKITIYYWVFTGIFGGFMLFSAIPDIIVTQEAIGLITTGLGYPEYIIRFLGVAKLLGVIAILVPGFPRLKEWAYAGLFFDLLGATYSAISLEGLTAPMLFMILPFGSEALSYVFHHKRLKAKGVA